MNEVEVINIFKLYGDKKTDVVIKSPAFSFSAVIWSHLAHSSLVQTIRVKQNGKHLEMDSYITITFPLQQHLALLAFRFAFRVFLIRLDCYIHLSKFTWK